MRSESTDRLFHAWQGGTPARNAWRTIPDPYLAELVAARAPIEAVTIDLQHGLFDHHSAVECLRAIAVHRASPMVRLPGLEPSTIGYFLDAGAAGVIAPAVDTAAQVKDFVRACNYPPKGQRSHGPNRGAVARGFDALSAAEQTVLFAMIETREGLENAELMAEVEGLTGLFVGPGDLGLALGIGPGQDRDEAEMHAAIDRVLDSCKRAGKRCAVHATDPRYAANMACQGFDLVTVWVDVVAIDRSFANAEQAWTEVRSGRNARTT